MKGKDRRDKLAEFRLAQAYSRPRKGLRAALSRAVDLWERFMPTSSWEKGFVAVAAVLIVGVLIGAIYILTSNVLSDGGKKHVAAGRLQAHPTRATPPAIHMPPPAPTAIVLGVPQLAKGQPTDRQDCEAIRGASYRSDAERAFFQQHCVTPTAPLANPRPGQGHPTQPPPLPAPPTAPPQPGGFTASDAIGLAVYWIAHNAPKAYTADASLCNAVDSAGHWVVTCPASLAGCQGSVCQTTLSVCVFTDPPQVRSADQC